MNELTAEQLITRILRVANDNQADMLDELLVAADYWWRCPGHGYFLTGELCDMCDGRYVCDGCGRVGTVDDGIGGPGDDCPDEECDGTVGLFYHVYVNSATQPYAVRGVAAARSLVRKYTEQGCPATFVKAGDRFDWQAWHDTTYPT